MKLKTTLLILLMILFINKISFSQWNPVTINFESITNSLITIDTTQPNNLWQIGRPQKAIFDTAYSVPNVIITDTINNYPINNTSSFQFTIYDSMSILWGGPNFYWTAIEVDFLHKFDTDTLHDGGYIEYSLDSGLTWTNIVNLNPWFYDFNLLFDGTPGFSGSSIGWKQSNFLIPFCLGPPTLNFVVIRFTFKSDSLNTNKEGWMIDDIFYQINDCEGINEQQSQSSIDISPNPFSSQTSITFSEEQKNTTIIITDVLGNIIRQLTTNNKQLTIDMSGFSKGIYFVRITDEKKNVINRKIVLQ